MKIRFSDRGFAPIRRGLREHLPGMSSDGVKFYLWLHLVARFSGKDRGTVKMIFADIARELGWSIHKLKRTARQLRKYVVVEPGNQHKPSTLRILNYDKQPQSAGAPHAPSKPAGAPHAPRTRTSTRTSTSAKLSNDAPSSTPKKAVEGSRSKAAAAAVWTFLEIEPCGHSSFRALLESCWASRNGEPPSAVVARCLDGWRDSNAGDETWKRGLAPLFRALNAVRQSEKVRADSGFKEEIPLATVNV